MVHAQESQITLELESENRLETAVEYFDVDGAFRSRTFFMTQHEERIRFTKLMMWALHKNVELRVRPKTN